MNHNTLLLLSSFNITSRLLHATVLSIFILLIIIKSRTHHGTTHLLKHVEYFRVRARAIVHSHLMLRVITTIAFTLIAVTMVTATNRRIFFIFILSY